MNVDRRAGYLKHTNGLRRGNREVAIIDAEEDRPFH